MKRISIALTMMIAVPVLGAARLPAQSMDDLNLQFHGYATQGFLYSTNNNWNSTASTDGSPAWTEAVVNLTAQPQPKLSVGVQVRYFLLGAYGNQITLDWAQGDYKVNEKLGFRAGKLKTPAGMLNEYQDVDPAFLWVLLPQSVYAISSRDSLLAHYGGVVYGTAPLGERFGKIDYRAYGGERIAGTDDEYLAAYRVLGLVAPDGVSGPTFGATLVWHTPIRGLFVGGSSTSDKYSGPVTGLSFPGHVTIDHLKPYFLFSKYEHGRWMVAGEYNRFAGQGNGHFAGFPPYFQSIDCRAFYGMASYKVTGKLTNGLYYSSVIDRKAEVSSARYQKDWALAARYDFSPFLYLKLEEHVMDGVLRGYSPQNNPAGLQPNTLMTLLKLGVSF